MHAARWILLGILLAVHGFGQGQIDIRNTATTPVYTNDCNGNRGLLRSPNNIRFMLYIAPAGTANRSLFTVIAFFTNSCLFTPPGQIFGSCQNTILEMPGNTGTPIAFYIRAVQLGVPCPLTGESEIGTVTPAAPPNPFPIPVVFGNDFPGQIGGFEIHGPCPVDGPFIITRFLPGVSISWTNAWSPAPANYRIRAAEFPNGPWTNLLDVQATNAQMTFALPPSGTATRFYSIEGTNALPAQPLGTWNYQALDKSGAILAAGTLSFTSNVPLLGSGIFTRMQNFLLHPAGTNAFSSAALVGSNTVQVAFGGFNLRGQMMGDHWAGNWSAVEIGGGAEARSHGGRFIATRCCSGLCL
jgi:hypothetical protein